MFIAIGGGDLHDTSFRREIALENHKAAGRLDGVLECVDDDLAWSLHGECGFVSERSAADGER